MLKSALTSELASKLTATLRSTSILALCAGIATPPALAEGEAVAQALDGLPVCETDGAFPCVFGEDLLVEDAEGLALAEAEAALEEAVEGAVTDAGDAAEAVTEGARDTAEAVSEAAAEAVDAAPAEAVDAAPAEAAPVETDPVETATDAAGEAVETVTEQARDTTEAVAETARETGEAVEAATEAPAAETPAEEAPAETADDAAPAEDTAADAPAEEAPAEDAAAETPADEAPAEDAASETPADEAPAEDAATETPADEAPAEDAASETPAEEAPAEDAASETPADETPAEDRAAETSGDTPPPAAAAAADDDGADDLLADDTAVETETVTEDNVRSSDENFDTGASGQASDSHDAAPVTATANPEAEAEAEASTGDSTDRFQKALALGLGALAVGAILSNGSRVVSNSGDRVVVESPEGELRVLKNDDETLRQPGSEVRTRTYEDGSSRTVVIRPDGSQIITIRAADGTALKRTRVLPNGDRYVLFDDTQPLAAVAPVPVAPPPAADISAEDRAALVAALMASMAADDSPRFALGDVRDDRRIRAYAPKIEVRAITFETGSAAIVPAQANRLADLGFAIAEVIEEVPGAVFLVEGHTDAVGGAALNLALSDRRAESVALALTEYFAVPPENLITQGYGESDLAVQTQNAARANRRVVVRNITPLLR